jgi:hypothetical protein
MRQKDFDRAAAAALRVPAFVHSTHAAFAEEAHNSVRTDLLGRRHGRIVARLRLDLRAPT